jgi:hypothetical protein
MDSSICCIHTDISSLPKNRKESRCHNGIFSPFLLANKKKCSFLARPRVSSSCYKERNDRKSKVRLFTTTEKDRSLVRREELTAT